MAGTPRPRRHSALWSAQPARPANAAPSAAPPGSGIVVVTLTGGQPAAVDPHQARARTAGGPGREDVQVKAVLGARPPAEGGSRLGTVRCETGTVTDAGPPGGRLRGPPSQGAHRRCGVGNAEELVDTLRLPAADGSFSRA